VQDLVAENFEIIYDLIFSKKGHLYICGDVRMATEVVCIIESSLKEKLSISLDEAKNCVNRELRVKYF